jgi:hypothetical protein
MSLRRGLEAWLRRAHAAGLDEQAVSAPWYRDWKHGVPGQAGGFEFIRSRAACWRGLPADVEVPVPGELALRAPVSPPG